MSRSEAVIEVRDILRFLFYLDILNKVFLVQCEHSKYMYARCLNFPCFINYLAACMHAFCMFHLYVLLGKSLLTSCYTSVNEICFFPDLLGIEYLFSTPEHTLHPTGNP